MKISTVLAYIVLISVSQFSYSKPHVDNLIVDAASRQNFAEMDWLLSLNFDTYTPNALLYSLITIVGSQATDDRPVYAARSLIQRGANTSLALMIAAQDNRAQCCTHLLAIDSEIPVSALTVALRFAALNNNDELMRVLVGHGASFPGALAVAIENCESAVIEHLVRGVQGLSVVLPLQTIQAVVRYCDTHAECFAQYPERLASFSVDELG